MNPFKRNFVTLILVSGLFNHALADNRLTVQLPETKRPIPEPLAADEQPGFKFRGIKGYCWTPEQYLEEIPTLVQLKLNFLMNCYGSMFTSAPGQPWRNEWWKPMTEARKEAYARVIHACATNGITFCFAFHPQIYSPRPLNLTNTEDLEAFYQHFAWAQSQGVHWFSVSLDDVTWGPGGPAAGAEAQAKLVDTIFSRLRKNDAGAQLIFCPGPYWGDGTDAKDKLYLAALAQTLHPDIYVFWTGDGVVTSHITLRAAESYWDIVKHRLFLWDNYPVNDGNPTLHLGPVSGRDAQLDKVIDGYISNPLATQNEINRLPLATCADYAYNPGAYDPARSIGQAILHLAATPAQQAVLKDLVETYPGFIGTENPATGYNPVRTKFKTLHDSSPAQAQDLIHHLENLSARLAEAFPNQFADARQAVQADINWMKEQIRTQKT